MSSSFIFFHVTSKLYGVNATIKVFVFVLYCIVFFALCNHLPCCTRSLLIRGTNDASSLSSTSSIINVLPNFTANSTCENKSESFLCCLGVWGFQMFACSRIAFLPCGCCFVYVSVSSLLMFYLYIHNQHLILIYSWSELNRMKVYWTLS